MFCIGSSATRAAGERQLASLSPIPVTIDRPTLDRRTLEVLFEGAPRFLDRIEAAGPFESPDLLFHVARDLAHAMPESEQIELIDAHPRLGASPETVSQMSYVEQGYDRGTGTADEATRTPVDVAAELERLNDAYERRHGFRYCVFVAGRPREALIPDMARAIEADRTTELHRAIDAVVDIAIDRHGKLTRR